MAISKIGKILRLTGWVYCLFKMSGKRQRQIGKFMIAKKRKQKTFYLNHNVGLFGHAHSGCCFVC